MKEMLYEVRCLKSNEESPEFFGFMRQLLKLSSKCKDDMIYDL